MNCSCKCVALELMVVYPKFMVLKIDQSGWLWWPLDSAGDVSGR